MKFNYSYKNSVYNINNFEDKIERVKKNKLNISPLPIHRWWDLNKIKDGNSFKSSSSNNVNLFDEQDNNPKNRGLIVRDQWISEVYYFNKNKVADIYILDNLIIKLLELLFSIPFTPYLNHYKSQKKSIISKPNFKHINLFNPIDNKVVITFLIYTGKFRQITRYLGDKKNVNGLCFSSVQDSFLRKLLGNIISLSNKTKSAFFYKTLDLNRNSSPKELSNTIFKNESEINNIYFPHDKYINWYSSYNNYYNTLIHPKNKNKHLNYRDMFSLINHSLNKGYNLNNLFIKNVQNVNQTKDINDFNIYNINMFLAPKYLEYYIMNIYNKKVVIKIIGLKKPYYSSDILTKNIAMFFDKQYLPFFNSKRKSLQFLVNILLNKIKIQNNLNFSENNSLFSSLSSKKNKEENSNLSHLSLDNISNNKKLINSLSLYNKDYSINYKNISSTSSYINSYIHLYNIDRILYNFLDKDKNINIINNSQYYLNIVNTIKMIITNHVKYKNIIGIRLSLSGRIAKRKIASRSRDYLFYKGRSKPYLNSTEHMYKSFYFQKNLPLNLGYIKSNIDTKRITCINKNGALSIKIDISSE